MQALQASWPHTELNASPASQLQQPLAALLHTTRSTYSSLLAYPQPALTVVAEPCDLSLTR